MRLSRPSAPESSSEPTTVPSLPVTYTCGSPAETASRSSVAAPTTANTDPSEPYEAQRDGRNAQLVTQRIEQAESDETESLDETERRPGGFAHSGR